jgi:hypothetical protein
MFRKTLVYETMVTGGDDKKADWISVDVDPSPISVLMCEFQDVLFIYWHTGCQVVDSLLSGK